MEMDLLMMLTEEQAVAQIRLARAIGVAVDGGLPVPCQSDPELWDDPTGSPTYCDGCEVLAFCRTYADTGAVQHGIMAGRRLSAVSRRGRRGLAA